MEALSLSTKPLPKVKVSPQVVFSILNSFSRRAVQDSRLVGTLLGEIRDNVIYVTECFAVPCTEEEGVVSFNTHYHKTMYSFHRRNNKKEVVVGWYATTSSDGAYLNNNSSVFNDFYANEHKIDPIHLVIDTTLLHDTVNVKGFMSRKNKIGDSFHDLTVDLQFTDSEATLIHHMIHGQEPGHEWESTTIKSTLPNAEERLNESIIKFQDLLDSLQQYVDDVVDGKVEGNREIGITIAEAINSFSHQALSTAQNQLINSRYNDLVMISYLSTLAQSQALVAEKLNQII